MLSCQAQIYSCQADQHQQYMQVQIQVQIQVQQRTAQLQLQRKQQQIHQSKCLFGAMTFSTCARRGGTYGAYELA